MKPGDRSAGDGDEEEGKDGGRTFGIQAECGGGNFERGTDAVCGDWRASEEGGGEETEDDERQGEDELQGIDEITRLEQGPDGQDGGDVGIGEEDDDPGQARQVCEGRIERSEEADIAEGDRKEHDAKGQQRRKKKVSPFPMNGDADPESDGDLEDAGNDGTWVVLKNDGDDQSKDSEDNGQGEEENGEKKEAGARGEDAAGDFAQRLASVPERDDEAPKVVHCPYEDGSKEDPEKGGDPSPDDRKRWTYDGTRARNGREVVAKNDSFGGGNEVFVIPKSHGGDLRIGIEPKDATSEPFPIGMVGDEIENEGSEGQGESLHAGGLYNGWGAGGSQKGEGRERKRTLLI